MQPTTLSGQLAANIRAELARRKRTQDDLADALGLARQTVTFKLAGRSAFTVDELALIALFLEVPPVQLLAGEGAAATIVALGT